MIYYFNPASWNAVTWSGVLMWFAVAVFANATWPIDRAYELQRFESLRADTVKLYPHLADQLPKSIGACFRSNYPLTY